MNTNIRIVLMILAVVVVVYLLYSRNNSAVSNEGTLEQEPVSVMDNTPMTMPQMQTMPSMNAEPVQSMERDLPAKFITRNTNTSAEPRVVSYDNNTRNQEGKWENQVSGDSLFNNEMQNKEVQLNDTMASQFASFSSEGNAPCGSNQNCSPEELFDSDKMLPQEVNDDWFQNVPEPVSVKNRHLINVTRPIGVNTIGNSTRNASYDLRGTIANPREVVSPFLNSSIEPDFNIKPNFC
jgi:hypothetical protein